MNIKCRGSSSHRASFLSSIVFLVLFGACPGTLAISLEQVGAFVGRNTIHPPVMSPDGVHVVTRVRTDGVWTVSAMRLSDRSSVLSMSMGEYTVGWVDWLDNETIILKAFPKGSSDGFWDRGEWRRKYLTIDLKQKQKKAIEILNTTKGEPKFNGVPRKVEEVIRFSSVTFHPTDFDKGDDMRAVIINGQRSLVMRYDAEKELFDTLGDIDGQIDTEYTNGKGEMLAAFGYPPHNIRSETERANHRDYRQLWYRDKGKDEWRVGSVTQVDSGSMWVIGAGAKKGQVYVLENIDHDIRGLSSLDLKSGEITPIFRPGRADVLGFDLDADRNLVAIRYDDNYPVWEYPNPKHPAAQFHAVLRKAKAFQHKSIKFVSFSRDNSKAIVQVTTDRDPGTYYDVDIATKKIAMLAKQSAATEKFVSGSRFPIEFKSRDGRRLTGYVTLPQGKEKNIPFVVMVRSGGYRMPGGQTSRWDFHEEAQLFASAGLGVLEVNYRGTVGYGLGFKNAAQGHWGDDVQNDITDGVKHIIANGTAKKSGICIYGHGFGAYSAMLQLAQEPGLYQCGIGFGGQYDLKYVYNMIKNKSAEARYSEVSAGPGADADDLARISPVTLAGRIKSPVMVMEGRGRGRDIDKQPRRFMDAMKSAGADVELHIEIAQSDQKPLDYANRRAAYKRLVEFIQEHTGG